MLYEFEIKVNTSTFILTKNKRYILQLSKRIQPFEKNENEKMN